MKKSVRAPKKPNTRGKKTVRRKKNAFSDALRAFMLAGVITIFAAAISLAIITVHSNLKNTGSITIGLPSVITEEEADTVKENIENNRNEKIDTQNNNEKKSTTITESPVPKIQVSAPEKNNDTQVQPRRETVPAPVARTSAPASNNPEPVNPTASNDALPARTSVPVNTQRANPAASNSTPSAVNTISATSTQKSTQNAGTLVFVIDDAGNNLRELEPFLRIPGPLTIAVLPGLPFSAEAARRIRAAGKEVILHQPMEAIGAQNPGPGAIYSGMTKEEIKSILTRNIAEIGPIAGINNHQGSKISMDAEIVEIILNFCNEQGIFFLDSRTTAETVFPVYARRLEMKIAQRDVFLDNEQDRNSMLRYITSGLTRAQRNGSAVMIGHVWSPELAPLLAEQLPILTIQGYTIKTVSSLIK